MSRGPSLPENALPVDSQEAFKMFRFARSNPKFVATANGSNSRLNGVTVTEKQLLTLVLVMENEGFADVGQAVRYLLDAATVEDGAVNVNLSSAPAEPVA